MESQFSPNVERRNCCKDSTICSGILSTNHRTLIAMYLKYDFISKSCFLYSVGNVICNPKCHFLVIKGTILALNFAILTKTSLHFHLFSANHSQRKRQAAFQPTWITWQFNNWWNWSSDSQEGWKYRGLSLSYGVVQTASYCLH